MPILWNWQPTSLLLRIKLKTSITLGLHPSLRESYRSLRDKGALKGCLLPSELFSFKSRGRDFALKECLLPSEPSLFQQRSALRASPFFLFILSILKIIKRNKQRFIPALYLEQTVPKRLFAKLSEYWHLLNESKRTRLSLNSSLNSRFFIL